MLDFASPLVAPLVAFLALGQLAVALPQAAGSQGQTATINCAMEATSLGMGGPFNILGTDQNMWVDWSSTSAQNPGAEQHFAYDSTKGIMWLTTSGQASTEYVSISPSSGQWVVSQQGSGQQAANFLSSASGGSGSLTVAMADGTPYGQTFSCVNTTVGTSVIYSLPGSASTPPNCQAYPFTLAMETFS